jgi:AcrR family transcriptional regulator
MFADRGFDAVTTREIAKAAAVTFPVMYRHFADKRALYLTAFGSALASADARYLAVLREAGDPQRRLFAFVSALYEDLLSDPCLSKLMQREILDRDDDGVARLTKSYFLEPYYLVRQDCERLVGKSKAELASIMVYIVTMGFAQFRPIGQTIAKDRPRWKEPAPVARLILELVFPRIKWARIDRKKS